MYGLVSRRNFALALSGTTACLGAGAAAASSGSAQEAIEPILQPVAVTEEALIERAFEMRRLAVEKGDRAYGAIVVRDGVILGQSWSRVILDQDPTAHAEISAIRDACRRLGNRSLDGAELYSSSRPCPMCEAAAFWAGIEGMVFGREATRGGVPKLCS